MNRLLARSSRKLFIKPVTNIYTPYKYLSTVDGSHSDFGAKKKSIPDGMDDVMKLINSQVKDNKVMLYMKGTPSQPQCGFSGQVIRLLHATGVDFSTVNVMEFPSIREGIKTYS